MTAKKKNSRLTLREKKERAEIKKYMQEKGILPPDKPRLNRKKFIEESQAEYNGEKDWYTRDVYLHRALSYMLAHTGNGMKMNPTLEAVGAAKVLKIAVELRHLHEGLKAEGKTVTLGEEFETAKKIMDL